MSENPNTSSRNAQQKTQQNRRNQTSHGDSRCTGMHLLLKQRGKPGRLWVCLRRRAEQQLERGQGPWERWRQGASKAWDGEIGGGWQGVSLFSCKQITAERKPVELKPPRCPPYHLGMWSTAHCCSARPGLHCSCPAGSSLAGSQHDGWWKHHPSSCINQQQHWHGLFLCFDCDIPVAMITRHW